PSFAPRGKPSIFKNLVTFPSLPLCAVTCNLGVTNQVFRIGVRACAECDSDACRSHHLVRVCQKRNPHSLLNTLRYSDGIARVSNILQQHRKFVSTEPG